MNYNSLKTETLSALEKQRTIVFATSKNNKVTARTMSHIVLNDKIYFQTDSKSLKYDQLSHNSDVALCVNNIRIKGTSKSLGNPFDEQNLEFLNKFKDIHKGSYEKYTKIETEVVIEITIKTIDIWNYQNGSPIIKTLDFENSSFRITHYNTK